MRIYLMSVPCSGKTHFARGHASYRGCRIVDFSPINKWASRDPNYGALCGPGHTYFERILSFLQMQTSAVCVLGRCGPEQPAQFENVVLAAVLPSREQHMRNSDERRQAHAQSKWSDFAKVELIRATLLDYVHRHRLPLYDSFQNALDDLIEP